MTTKEKKVYSNWNKDMTAQGNMRAVYFKQMQEMYEQHGGGRATCSLEANLAYLLTSENEETRNRALNIYRQYWEAEGQYDALLELGTALASAQ